MPGLDRPQFEPANPRAQESPHLVTELEEHQTNLPLNTLAKNDLYQRGSNDPNSLCLRPATFDHESSQKSCRMLRVKRSVQEHFVFLFDLVPWMCQTLGKSTVVGEKNQSLAVLIEPADMKEPSKMRRHEVEDGRAFPFIGVGAQNALWLVQEDVNRWGGAGLRFSGDAHVVARLHRSLRDCG